MIIIMFNKSSLLLNILQIFVIGANRCDNRRIHSSVQQFLLQKLNVFTVSGLLDINYLQTSHSDFRDSGYTTVSKWTSKVDIFDKQFIIVPICEAYARLAFAFVLFFNFIDETLDRIGIWQSYASRPACLPHRSHPQPIRYAFHLYMFIMHLQPSESWKHAQ